MVRTQSQSLYTLLYSGIDEATKNKLLSQQRLHHLYG